MNKIKKWLHHRKQKKSVIQSISCLLSVSARDMDVLWEKFDTLYKQKRYAQLLGESKTLNRLEAFIAYVVLAGLRPASIVEIGTHYGKSTRRILDMKTELELTADVSCYDIINNVRFFEPEEASLIIEDITFDTTRFLSGHPSPKFIFLDARPFDLLKNVIMSCFNDLPDAIMIIHDCSPSICRREMQLDRSCLDITSATGVWERHVLAECVGISDPLSSELNNFETDTHHGLIFDTDYGLGLLIPKEQVQVVRDGLLRFLSK